MNITVAILFLFDVLEGAFSKSNQTEFDFMLSNNQAVFGSYFIFLSLKWYLHP